MQEPVITVGILSGKEIGFSFPKEFISSDGIAICGIQQAVYRKGKICWQEKEYDELSFTPQQDTSSFFELQDVTIGINFHWERKEVQRFKGELKIIVEDDRLTAINIIPIEDYLTSVISSEMSATASLELLKAHAVISRSWLLNKLKVANGKLKVIMHPDNTANFELSTLPSQLIKWYDHEAHKNFDVCADDHCQRYQGITRTSTPQAIEAVYPKTEIQQCIIHQIRNSTKFVSYKDIKKLMADLKLVYAAPTEETALNELELFKDKWDSKYPKIYKSWHDNWATLSTYFKYPEAVRRLIYTTNAIEGFNRQLRKVTKSKAVFPSDDSLLKMLYLATMDITKKWTGHRQDWGQIHSQLEIYFEERLAGRNL